VAYNVVKWAGVIYLLYLAWRIATAGLGSRDARGRGKPLSFMEAALFGSGL